MTGNAFSLVPNLHRAGVDPGLNFEPCSHRDGVEVGPNLDPSHPVDSRKTDFSQVEPILSQGEQMLLFCKNRLANRYLPTGDPALFVRNAGGQQLRIQIFQIQGLGNGNPVIAAEITTFTLDAPFFMGTVHTGIAEHGLKPPVRTECDESRGLFPMVSLKDLFYRQLEIVVSETFE